MLNTFSSRLKVCRTITGLTAAYIVNTLNATGVPLSDKQYLRWENGITDITKSNKNNIVEKIVDIFNEHGLEELSPNWLINGKGMPPFLVDISNSSLEEISFYIARCLGEKYSLININSNFAEPYAFVGDHLIVHEQKLTKLENRISFIRTKNGEMFVGIVANKGDTIEITTNIITSNIKKDEIKNSARVVWIG